ncbi:membrane protein (plasmid) [Alteromonas sp. I4]|nr:membrane protein [Alteromonas sp. I4]
MSSSSFTSPPLPAKKLESAKYFAACYAGEHVAGTEFVIGALFVTWGVGMTDILLGLIFGNLLAVLTWATITAPIATQTRLTMFAYLEKIAGFKVVQVYSALCAFLFCIGAGSMITVSASAIKILFNLPSQVNWYPEDIRFVAVVVVVGLVITGIAIGGFKRVARFAEVCAPWMILMFIVGAFAIIPTLLSDSPATASMGFWDTLSYVGNAKIWTETEAGLTFWHVMIFAWVCNLVMHGGMSDMTLFRFAKKPVYGYFSALGMFIGHFVAWICAGMMGAAAAIILNSDITKLDAGDVAYQVLGLSGIIAVVIAGWTTSNPTIYRAGIALQSLLPNKNRRTSTLLVGMATTIIACFPFVFTMLADVVSWTALILCPLGGVIIAEHILLPKLGMTRYWSNFKKNKVNPAACLTWISAMILGGVLSALNVHNFFLPLIAWLASVLIYCVFAYALGARKAYPVETAEELKAFRERREQEATYFSHVHSVHSSTPKRLSSFQITAYVSLFVCLLLSILTATDSISLSQFKHWLIYPTLIYFVTATYWLIKQKSVHIEATSEPAATNN